MTKNRRRIPLNQYDFLALVLILTFLLSCIATLEDYAIQWDELENFFVGLTTLRFFQTWNVDYLDFSGQNPIILSDDRHLLSAHIYGFPYDQSGFYYPAVMFPPFANMVSAATYLIFNKQLGILTANAAYHLASVFFATFLLVGVYFFTRDFYGSKVALFAVLFLGGFPAFFGHAHQNIKDIPQAFFFFSATAAFIKAVDTHRSHWFVLTGVLLGLGLSTKINILLLYVLFFFIYLFMVIIHKLPNTLLIRSLCLIEYTLSILIVILFLLVVTGVSIPQLSMQVPQHPALIDAKLTYKVMCSIPSQIILMRMFLLSICSYILIKKIKARRISFPRLIPFNKIVIMYVFALILFFTSWPFLWEDPVTRLTDMTLYFRAVGRGFHLMYGGQFYLSGVNLPWHYAPLIALFQTPEPTLFLFFLGFMYCFSERKNSTTLLAIIALAVLIKYLIPGVVIYDGMRQELELIPFIAVFASLGASRLIDSIRHVKQQDITRGLFILLLFYFTAIIIQLHPFQAAYFNVFIGGPRGAEVLFEVDQTAVVNAYPLMVQWIYNKQPGASISAGFAGHIISRELTDGDSLRPVDWNAGPDYIPFLNKPSARYSPVIDFLMSEHKPIYTVSIAGAPMGFVYNTTNISELRDIYYINEHYGINRIDDPRQKYCNLTR